MVAVQLIKKFAMMNVLEAVVNLMITQVALLVATTIPVASAVKLATKTLTRSVP